MSNVHIAFKSKRSVVSHYEISAGWRKNFEARFTQTADDNIAATSVLCKELIVIRLRGPQRGDRAVLQRRRGGEGEKLVGRTHAFGQRRRRDRPADLPPSQRKGLAQR